MVDGLLCLFVFWCLVVFLDDHETFILNQNDMIAEDHFEIDLYLQLLIQKQ